MDIEKVAKENPKKIFTNKYSLKENLDDKDINKIFQIFQSYKETI